MSTSVRSVRLAAWFALAAVAWAGWDRAEVRAQVWSNRDTGGQGVPPPPGSPQAEFREPAVPPITAGLPPTQDRIALVENRQVITFGEALATAAGRNPQIGYANGQINEAFAQLRGARFLWLPSIQAGINYQNHDGPVQNSDGSITVASRSALQAGLGMYAVGGGAPAIPGVTAKFAMADAVFQPRIANQQVAARQNAAAGTAHDYLLYAAVAYLDLLRAFQQQAISQETLDHAAQLAQLTADFARTGQGNQADADRAQAELSVRRNVLAQSVAQTQVASAKLVELLNMSPDRTLVPAEPTLVPIELVSHEAAAAQLVADGLSRRPELAESRNLVAAAEEQLCRERYAPLLPNVLVDVSQSGFGGGPDSTIADFRGRFDFDATAYWQLRNFGMGELSARDAARSRLEQAQCLQQSVANRISREVLESHAQAESLRGQIAVAETGIRVAAESYRRNVERIRGGQGLPLEVLQSIQALDQSRREYLRAVGEYDEWQFRLYRALGCPIPIDPRPSR
jgi:outer membrane protein TolC